MTDDVLTWLVLGAFFGCGVVGIVLAAMAIKWVVIRAYQVVTTRHLPRQKHPDLYERTGDE